MSVLELPHATYIHVEPQAITESDFGWMRDLGMRRYDTKYDLDGVARWMAGSVLKRPDIFHACRMPNAFCVSMLTKRPWKPKDVECSVMLVASEEGHVWDAIKCLRASIIWGGVRGASSWKLASDTDFELGPIANRLGVDEISSRYVFRY